MALTTKTIINDGQFLVVTSSSGNVESINLAVIKNITYTYVASPPGTYNYTDMCLLTVEFADREADLSFDLASITNQAGWTLDEAGCIQAESDIRTWAKASGGGGGGGDATEATQLLVEANTAGIDTNVALMTPDIEAVKIATQASAPKANALSSVKTTAGGTIPAGSKAASIFIDGSGATVNGVERPDGWSQSFEFNNNTLPVISYDGMGTATVYVDILT
jgi:hypothetical protein